jgi:hypothetical protein
MACGWLSTGTFAATRPLRNYSGHLHVSDKALQIADHGALAVREHMLNNERSHRPLPEQLRRN